MYSGIYFPEDGKLSFCLSSKIKGKKRKWGPYHGCYYRCSVFMQSDEERYIHTTINQLENGYVKFLPDKGVEKTPKILILENTVLHMPLPKNCGKPFEEKADEEVYGSIEVNSDCESINSNLNDSDLLELAGAAERFLSLSSGMGINNNHTIDVIDFTNNTDGVKQPDSDAVLSVTTCGSSYMAESNYHNSEEVSTHIRTTSKTTWEKYPAKQEFCIFCSKLKTHIARHYASIHPAEQRVKDFMMLPKKSKERYHMIEMLRKEGQFIFNKANDVCGSSFLSARRFRSPKKLSDVQICPRCKGYYSKKSLRQHIAKCDPLLKNTKAVSILGRRLENRTLESASEKLKTDIFPVMRDDEVGNVLKFDKLAVEVGNSWCRKYRDIKDQAQIRNNLRLLGRLLIKMRTLSDVVTDLASIFRPQLFRLVLKAIEQEAGVSNDTEKYATPYVASALGTLLNKCGNILKYMLIEKQDSEGQKNLADFFALMSHHLTDTINKTVAENQKETKRRKRISLPEVSDIEKLASYVKKERIKFTEVCQKNVDYSIYKKLLSLVLIELIVFNRRRPGEAERLFIKDFQACETASDKNSHYVRVPIRGKKGRDVSILIATPLKNLIEHVLNLRSLIGIPEKNPYVFGLKSVDGRNKYMRACNYMRIYSVECGAKNPASLRCTLLRKQIATYASEIKLDDQRISDLATFMGHADKIHKEHYRMPLVDREIKEMSTILESAQTTKIISTHKDKASPAIYGELNSDTSHLSLDEAEGDMSLTNINCNSNSIPSKFRNDLDLKCYSSDLSVSDEEERRSNKFSNKFIPTRSRKSWTDKEKKILLDEFRLHVENASSPRLDECLRVIRKHNMKRTCTQVKACLYNMMSKQQKRNSTTERTRWSDEEIKIVKVHFSDYISKRRVPSEHQCQLLKKSFANELKNRTPIMIKTWVYNNMKKKYS